MNRGITYDLAIETFAEDFIGPREPPNAIEILIEVMNDELWTMQILMF